MLFRKNTGKNKFEFRFSTEMLAVSVDDTAQTALELIRSSKNYRKYFLLLRY
jgi:hypothetical protein